MNLHSLFLLSVIFTIVLGCRPTETADSDGQERLAIGTNASEKPSTARPIDLGQPLTCTRYYIYQAEYSPDGSHLAMATQITPGSLCTVLVMDRSSGRTTDLKTAVAQRPAHQLQSASWISSDRLVVTEVWGPSGQAPYQFSLTTIDVTANKTVANRPLGVWKQDRPYHLVGAASPDIWLVEPLEEAPSCGIFEYKPAMDAVEGCLLPIAGDDVAQRTFSRPWVSTQTHSFPYRGEQTVTFVNVQTRETKTLSGVPFGADAALLSADGRFVICSVMGQDACQQTPMIIDSATGQKRSLSAENWRPVALTSAGDALLVGTCAATPEGNTSWTYYQIRLSDVLDQRN